MNTLKDTRLSSLSMAFVEKSGPKRCIRISRTLCRSWKWCRSISDGPARYEVISTLGLSVWCCMYNGGRCFCHYSALRPTDHHVLALHVSMIKILTFGLSRWNVPLSIRHTFPKLLEYLQSSPHVSDAELLPEQVQYYYRCPHSEEMLSLFEQSGLENPVSLAAGLIVEQSALAVPGVEYHPFQHSSYVTSVRRTLTATASQLAIIACP